MTYSFTCNNNYANKKQLEALKENIERLYGNSGLTIRLTDEDNLILVNVGIIEYTALRSTKRNAGRHKSYTDYKCQDIADMQLQGLSPEDIADKLHMSRSTYFRHLKRMNEHNNMDRYF